jgi:hypothetical protein
LQLIVPAIVCDPEEPGRETRSALETFERKICLKQRFLGNIVSTETVPSTQTAQESSQRLLLGCCQLYELLLSH